MLDTSVMTLAVVPPQSSYSWGRICWLPCLAQRKQSVQRRRQGYARRHPFPFPPTWLFGRVSLPWVPVPSWSLVRARVGQSMGMGDIAYRHTAQGLSSTRRMCCQCVARRSHRQRILCNVSTSAICAILLILGNVMHYIYLHIFSSLLAYRDLEMGPSTTLAVHSRAAMNGRLTALHKLVYCTISTDCSQLLEKTRPRWPIHFIYIEIVFFRM